MIDGLMIFFVIYVQGLHLRVCSIFLSRALISQCLYPNKGDSNSKKISRHRDSDVNTTILLYPSCTKELVFLFILSSGCIMALKDSTCSFGFCRHRTNGT